MKKLIYIIPIVLFLASCSGGPIFYTLENEEKIEDTNNFKPNTPANRILLFEDTANDYYVTHGKQLWYSIANTQQNPWNMVPRPSGYSSNAVFPSIAEFNGRLYTVISDDDSNSRNGLYYINSVTDELTRVFEYERVQGDGDDYYFYQLNLYSAGDDLYISRIERKWNTGSSDNSTIVSSELYHFASGAALNAGTDLESGTLVSLPGLTGTGYTVRSVTTTGADAPGEIYMVINETGSGIDYYGAGRMYRASTGSPTVFTEESPGRSCSYNHVYYSEQNDILLASTRETGDEHSILYKLNNSGSWGSWQTDLQGSSDVQFSFFADISGMSTVDNIILVGTRGDVVSDSTSYYNGSGYYELNLADRNEPVIQTNTFSHSANYNSTDLKEATIMSILFDQTRNKVYMTTSSTGLWMNQVDSSDDQRKWYQE
ncbi:MAG: hypothetical protein PQJ58_04630 [Spirochaetales bacterium]|nr:hypothetical protein [Spirochaetales bacterium]